MDTSLNPALIGIGVTLLGIAVGQLNRISKRQAEQGDALTEIRVTLSGANGDNGINGEVKALRARSHHQGDEIHAIHGKMELVTLRIENIERRTGPDDRRAR